MIKYIKRQHGWWGGGVGGLGVTSLSLRTLDGEVADFFSCMTEFMLLNICISLKLLCALFVKKTYNLIYTYNSISKLLTYLKINLFW